MSVYLIIFLHSICLGEAAMRKFERFKNERYDLIAEVQLWFEKCMGLETKVDNLQDSIILQERVYEERIAYWRKMYTSLCRIHKRLVVRKHSRCPKATRFLYR